MRAAGRPKNDYTPQDEAKIVNLDINPFAMINVQEVTTPKQLKQFIRLPYRLYANDPHWIPPLLADEKKYWTRHPGLRKNTVKMFLAYKNGKPAGRIGFMVNKRYNELNDTRYARFFALEATDDAAVFDALLGRAEDEARRAGMTRIHGPLGYNNLDHQGLLVEGFDRPQILVSVYNKTYYKDHLERLGYQKEHDWVETRITVTDEPVEKGRRGAALIKRRFGIEAWQPANKEEMLEQTEAIFEIYNRAYRHLHYMVPLDDDDVAYYKKAYINALLPKWTFFGRDTKHDSRMVGMMLTLPSLGDAFRKARGRLFPFGWYHLLRALRRPKEIDIAIIAVMPEYFAKGVAAVIFDRFHQVMLENGIRVFETGPVFEDNHNVLSNWKNYEHEQHKRKRVYGKDIR